MRKSINPVAVISALLLVLLLCFVACADGDGATGGCGGVPTKETELGGAVDVKEPETPGESGIDWEEQWGTEENEWE